MLFAVRRAGNSHLPILKLESQGGINLIREFPLRAFDRHYVLLGPAYLYLWLYNYWSASNTRHAKTSRLPNVADNFTAKILLIRLLACHQPLGGRENGYSQPTTDAGNNRLLCIDTESWFANALQLRQHWLLL